MKLKFIVLITLSVFVTRVRVYSRQNSDNSSLMVTDTVLSYKMNGVTIIDNKNHTPILISQPTATLEQRDLQRYSPSSVTEQFAKLPGVSMISFGEGITRPVIRGLGGSRIKTVVDGLAMETQVWDELHGIGINERDFTTAKAVLGPSVLLYGTDAIGGALIFNDELSNGIKSEADATAGFISNGLGYFGGIDFKGSTGESSYWKVSAFTKSISDYRYENNLRAFNTRFWRSGLNAIYGFDEDWGNFKIRYKLNHGLYGILDPFEIENGFDDGEEYPHEFEAPYHMVLMNRLQINSNIKMDDRFLNLAIAYDLDIRDEFEPKNGNPKLPQKMIGLMTHATHFKGSCPIFLTENFETKIGIRNDYSTMRNNAPTTFIPDNDVIQIGGFAISEYKLDELVMSAGISYDLTSINTKDYNNLFGKDITKNYSAPSGNIGLSWVMSDYDLLSMNMSTGFRAPNVNELASTGFKPESRRREYGNNNLEFERVYGVDLSYGGKSHSMKYNATIYLQDFNNFIYLEETFILNPIDIYPSFNFLQKDVQFYGFELTWGITGNWENSRTTFDIVFSTTKNDLESENTIIYNLPADKLALNLDHQFADFLGLHNPTLSLQWIQYMNIWDDGRLDVNSNGKWYNIMNINFESNIKFDSSELTIGLSGKNIFNTKYVSPLSNLSLYNVPNPGFSINAYFRYPFEI